MLTSTDFPNRAAVTFDLRDLLAELKAVDVLLVGWFDPVRGLQVMPIGDQKAVRPETKIYGVPGQYEVSILMATKMLLDEGNENGAYACLAQMADENRGKTNRVRGMH